MSDPDDDLAAAIRELSETLQELRRAFEDGARDDRARGYGGRSRGFPLRPPSPRTMLRFADDVAIPALIAVLEANVRALEAFQRSLRLVQKGDDARTRTRDVSTTTRERADELRTTTLAQLDAALDALQRAASEGALPQNDRARTLLEDARTLRDDVDRRLQEATSETEATETRIDVVEGDDEPEPDTGVDVDAELETLKDRYGPEEEPPDDGDEDGMGGPGDGERGNGGESGSENGEESGPDEGDRGSNGSRGR